AGPRRLDLPHQHHYSNGGDPVNLFVAGRKLGRLGLALILAGCAAAAPPTPSPTAEPSAAPTPTAAPTASPESTPGGPTELPVDGRVQPGQYFGEFEGYKFVVTVPNSGWTWTREYESFHQGHEHNNFAIFRPGGFITTLYAKACDSEGTEFEVGPTVDDLANALASLEDFDVSEPIDVTVSGYQGKRVRVTVPMDVDPANPECYDGYSLGPGYSYAVAGQTDDIWIIDMDGTRLVPTIATGPETPAATVEEAEAMLASLILEPN
ncbi:MAG TPA: hypothetical protein VM284_05620, partial [Candidatus Limnocylindria bacterium]|nr:hypothetical protein [Candidatus Limnocylindria bacterium]